MKRALAQPRETFPVTLVLVLVAALTIALGAAVGRTINVARDAHSAAADGGEGSRRIGSAALASAPGAAPFASLREGAQPLRGAFRGNDLVVLALMAGEENLSLFMVQSNGLVRETALPLPNRGLWAGLAVGADGEIWTGAGNQIVHIASNGASETLSVPAATHPVRGQSPPSPMGAIEQGQVSALSVSGGALYIGRVGHAEVTIYNRTTGTFDARPLPTGVGDIADLLSAADGSVLFTVNHSGRLPGQLNDVLGSIDPVSGVITVRQVAARSVTSRGGTVVAGGGALSWIEATGVSTVAPQSSYDLSQIALMPNGTTAVRPAGGHEIAFLDRAGRETRRVTYEVPLVPTRDRGWQPYSSRFAFVLAGTDQAAWFGLQGWRELYRVK